MLARVNDHLRLSPSGLAFIKGFEWFVPYPYDDALPPVAPSRSSTTSMPWVARSTR